MTNQESICYKILMLRSLIRQHVLKTDEKDIYHIFNNMYSKMDIVSESEE